MEINNKMNSFSLNHTNYCKGIAIIFMVIHHLFWNVPNIGYMVGEMALSQRIGIIGKVCVAIFLYLSGIGLYKSSPENISYREFYKKKVGKLYENYLFIVLFSIIFSLLFFYDKFLLLVGTGISAILRIILTSTGLQYYIGYQGFNPSWWFMTVIITCYMVFPLIYRGIKSSNYKLLILCFAFLFLNQIPLGRLKIFDILFWLVPFILGVIVAHNKLLENIKFYIEKSSLKLWLKFGLFFLLILFMLIRQEFAMEGFIGLKLDFINAFLIILNVYIFYDRLRTTHKFIIYLGIHSMNIYYIHMFISNYYLSKYIYALMNPVLMVIAVFILSLIGSYLINYIKKSYIHIKVNFINRLHKAN